MPETTIRPARPSLGSIRFAKSAGGGGQIPQSAGQVEQLSGGMAPVAQIPLSQTSMASAARGAAARKAKANRAIGRISFLVGMEGLLASWTEVIAAALPVVVPHDDDVCGARRNAGGRAPAIEDAVDRVVRVDGRADLRPVLTAGVARLQADRGERR